MIPDAPQREPLLRRIPPIPFAFLALAVIFVLYQLVGGLATFLLFGGRVVGGDVTLMRWATLGGQILFLLVPTLLLARLRAPGPSYYFPLRTPGATQILLACVAVFALQQVLQVYLLVQDAIPLPAPVKPYIEEFKRLIEETYRVLVTARSPGELAFVVVVVAVVPALCEELLFRGLVQRSIALETGGLPAALIVGAVFGAYHLSPFTLVPLAALGMFFGFLVHRTGNILVAVAAHFFNNSLAAVAAYYGMDEDVVNILPGNLPQSITVAGNVLLFGLVFVAATYYFVRITHPEAGVSGKGG